MKAVMTQQMRANGRFSQTHTGLVCLCSSFYPDFIIQEISFGPSRMIDTQADAILGFRRLLCTNGFDSHFESFGAFGANDF
jgi:hypothetical protein